ADVHLVGRDDFGADRHAAGEVLPGGPLGGGPLPVPAGSVVEDHEAGDRVERLLRTDVAAAGADHDAKLALVVELAAQGGLDQVSVGGKDAVAAPPEGVRHGRHRPPAFQRVLAVVQSEAQDPRRCWHRRGEVSGPDFPAIPLGQRPDRVHRRPPRLQHAVKGGHALVAGALTDIDVAGAPPHVQARSPGRGDRGQPHTGRCSAKGTSTPKSPTSGAALPRAVHAPPPVHETPLNPLTWACGGLGAGWTVQAVPFHASARVRVLKLEYRREKPTAVHLLAAMHATPLSPASLLPAGTGRRRMVHAVPFHVPAWALLPTLRTAAQALGAVQDTESSGPKPDVGVGSWLQVVPFHASTRGLLPPEPTATQEPAAVQNTALNKSPLLSGSRVVRTLQLFPFHDSASVWPVPAVSSWAPTAMPALAAVQDAPRSVKSAAPTGPATATMCQALPSHDSASGRVAPDALS